MPSFRVAFRRLFLLRMAGTVSLRFAYPFLPIIADGLDTSIATLGVGIAFGEVAGLAVPALGRRLDRIGRRRGMLDGTVVSAVGCVVVAGAPNVAVFGAGLFVVAIGRFLYDVSMVAWIGDEVSFERRGRANGIGELAWSGAFFVGVPVAGLVMSVSSWRVPYLLSALLLVASVPVVRTTLARQAPTSRADAAGVGRARITPLHVSILALSVGAALLFVTEGAWFERDLDFTERTVSFVVILLGVGEILGTLTSAFLADRIGKRRSILAGVAVLVPAAWAFALVGDVAVAAVVAAFMVGLGFELAFVSALPLVVEVEPDRRAAATTFAVAALTVGRTIAALVGTQLFESSGIGLVVAVSVPSLVLAGLVVAALVREPQPLMRH